MHAYVPFDPRAVAEEDWEPAPTTSADPPGVSAMLNHRPQPLSPDYPCVVCSGTQRWDHHGVWRCVACWPPEAF
jgi:hypothetical protein